MTRPERWGLPKENSSRALVARVALDALDLVQLLDPRLGLFGLRGLVAEALDEALHPLYLGLLLLDGLAQGDVAGGLFAAPLMPGAREEARPAGLQLEDCSAHGLQEPAVVGDQHDGSVEVHEGLLQPLQGLDVEMVGGLVQQQHVRARGQRPRQRGPRQLPAGEGVQAPLQIRVGEAQAVGHGGGPGAPQVPAPRLQAGLRGGVARQRRLVGLAAGHARLQLGQLRLDGQLLGAARQQVLLQGDVPLAGRALVVQGDPGALRHGQLATVDRGLPRQHPQQGRLAGAVAPGDGQAFAALQLEGDPPQQRRAGDVLVQVGCDQQSHRLLMVGTLPGAPEIGSPRCVED